MRKQNGHAQPTPQIAPYGAQLMTMVKPQDDVLLLGRDKYVGPSKDCPRGSIRLDDGRLEPFPEGKRLALIPDNLPDKSPEFWELVVFVQAYRVRQSSLAMPDDRIPMAKMGVGKPICRIPLAEFNARADAIIDGTCTADFMEWV